MRESKEAMPFPHVMALFEAQARRAPDAVAVKDSGGSLTYRELEERSRAVAHALLRRELGRSCLIALQGARCNELVVALFAILRTGAACLPIDAAYPAQRRQFMLADSMAKVVLVVGGESNRDEPVDVPLVSFDALAAENPSAQDTRLPEFQDDDAYVLYTSGSSGQPKGVAMGHQALGSLMAWQGAQSGDVSGPTLQFAPISFDVAFQEVFSTLCFGGMLVMIGEADRLDPQQLLRTVIADQVWRLFLPTAALESFATAAAARRPECLRHVVVAGEQLIITPAIRRFFSLLEGCRLHNQYGPTETHVVTNYTLPGDPASWPLVPPIGSPLPHAFATVLGPDGEELAHGELGELYLGGASLARGYLNRPALTAERFIEHRFAGRLYRSGDLARFEGQLLHFCGRADQQVKISGHRVEIGEVEAQLSQHPDVATCVVSVATDSAGVRSLVGFVVPREDPGRQTARQPPRREGSSAWQSFLRQRLPEFMVPTKWVTVESLPKTPSGKVDRARLPAVPRNRPAQSVPLRLPRSDLEAEVATLWRDLLELSEVGVEDAFFELGGSSLLLARLQVLLSTKLGIDCTVGQLISHPTIRSFCESISPSAAPSPGRMPSNGDNEVSKRPGPRRQGAASPVAIVGLACRFPGADNPSAFWANLRDGTESIVRSESGNPSNGDAAFVHAAGLLTGIDQFDANFFGFSRRDAELLDPQHRVFLECSVEALEDAAVDTALKDKRVGVFGGCGPSTYLLNNLSTLTGESETDRTLIASTLGLQLLLATDKDFLNSRVSYKLNLTGPSVNVNAACATSLFAVHLACQALANGECDMALAGAACIPTPQVNGHAYEPGMVFSPDGRCRPFSADAQGTVFGSGVGVVALKLLEQAIDDGDHVYAVIEGSSINNDGSAKAGMTAPSLTGQVGVIAGALRAADVRPEDISYIEGHGTATELGDHIEVAALKKVFGRAAHPWCTLGSVKGNVGHLGWAAGMAGLIKTALALHHKQIPATLHCPTPNAILTEAGTPFVVSDRLKPWPATGPRRAGVSAFGLGGANAHLVLSESPVAVPRRVLDEASCIVPISAATEGSLKRLANDYARFLERHPEVSIADVARTAAVGRRHHAVRRAVVVRSRDELTKSLSAPLAEHLEAARDRTVQTSRRVVALFTGQGFEYVGMGRELYDVWPEFRRVVDSSDPIFLEYFDQRAIELLRSDGDSLRMISRVQPIVFVVQMGLVALWRSWGVDFNAVLGHSLGEFAAACTAGVMTFDDGLRLVAERGRLLESLSANAAMLAVFVSSEEVKALIDADNAPVEVAAINSPANTVVSGSKSNVSRFAERAIEVGWEVRELRVSRAGHSSLMEPILAPFEAAAAAVRMRNPKIDLISNLTGEKVDTEVCRPQYWRRHLRETVRFAEGVRAAARLGVGAFIEIGCGSGLLSLGEATLPEHSAAWLPSLRRNSGEAASLLQSAAELYEAGWDLAWNEISGRNGRRVSLPTYPFERQRYWIDHKAVQRPVSVERGPTSPSWTELLYAIDWQEHAVCTPGVSASDADWLVVATSPADAIVSEMRRLGARCVVIRPGAAYGKVSDSEFEINPCSHDDLGRVLRECEPRHIAGVVYCASLASPPPSGAAGIASMKDSVDHCMRSVLVAAQVLLGDTCQSLPSFWMLTSGAQAAKRALSDHSLHQSPVLGFRRVLALESPHVWCASLDVDPRVADGAATAAKVILSERVENELVVVGSKLFVPRLSRTKLPADVPSLSPTDTYLIVGGLAGLGLLCAEVLVSSGARNLVVASRTGSNVDSEALAQPLRRSGANVELLAVDVADAAQVMHLIEESQRRGRLAGLLHCAGVLDDGVVSKQTWERFAKPLSAKVLGGWNLHVALVELGLVPDFFILFSSSTSLLGDVGQSNHAAACSFLDELAIHRQALGLPCTSVNWGAWSEDGYLKNRRELLDRMHEAGMGSISRAQGTMILHRILHAPQSRLAVLPNEWPSFLRTFDLERMPFFSQIQAKGGIVENAERTSVASQVAEAHGQDRTHVVLRSLGQIVSSTLGNNWPGDRRVDSGTTFVEMGMDSLQAIRLQNAIQRTFRCKLTPRLAYRFPTIESLAAHLLTEVFTPAWDDSIHGAQERSESFERNGAGASSKSPEATGRLSTQQRRWLSLIRGADYGHRVVPLIFHAELSRDALSKALSNVVQRHPLLRYRYAEETYEVLPLDDALAQVGSVFVDLKGLDPAGRRSALHDEVVACRQSLDSSGQTASWRLRCLDWEADKFVVLLGLQHIEFDGTSLTVFVDELREGYAMFCSGKEKDMSAPVPYGEYVAAQEAYIGSGMAEDTAFFEGLYAGVQRTTTLPKHPGYEKTRALLARRYTPSDGLARWEMVTKVANTIGVSPFAILLASYARMLKDVFGSLVNVIGVVSSGRLDNRFARTIGPFTTHLPVPIVGADEDVTHFVRLCHRLVGNVTHRSLYPTSELTKLPAFAGFAPDSYFSDVCINFLSYQRQDLLAQPHVEVVEILSPVEALSFDPNDFSELRRIPGLHLVADVHAGLLRGNYWYHVSRFEESQVADWSKRHRIILNRMLDAMETRGASAV